MRGTEKKRRGALLASVPQFNDAPNSPPQKWRNSIKVDWNHQNRASQRESQPHESASDRASASSKSTNWWPFQVAGCSFGAKIFVFFRQRGRHFDQRPLQSKGRTLRAANETNGCASRCQLAVNKWKIDSSSLCLAFVTRVLTNPPRGPPCRRGAKVSNFQISRASVLHLFLL